MHKKIYSEMILIGKSVFWNHKLTILELIFKSFITVLGY